MQDEIVTEDGNEKGVLGGQPKTPLTQETNNVNPDDNSNEKATYYVNELIKTNYKCDDHREWIRICYMFASLGEAGRAHYHTISKTSEKYSFDDTDDKFTEIAEKYDPEHDHRATTSAFAQFCTTDHKVKKFPKAKAKKVLQQNDKEWLHSHVFAVDSIKADNREAYILVDDSKVCAYFGSTSMGKPSTNMLRRIAEIRGADEWMEFKPIDVHKFNNDWIQRDGADDCYLYCSNCTIKIMEDTYKIVPAADRQLIWASMVMNGEFHDTNVEHPIVPLAKNCVVDYPKLQIGMGHLMHRDNKVNMAKIVWCVDHNPKSRHDGRRGKDLLTTLLDECRTSVPGKWRAGHNFWISNPIPPSSILRMSTIDSPLMRR